MTSPGEIAGETNAAFCSQCGQPVARDEWVTFGRAWICANCKPVFVGRLIEGGSFDAYRYAGFWLRFAAKMIDGVVVSTVDYTVGFLGLFAIGGLAGPNPDPLRAIWGLGFFYGFQFLFAAGYEAVCVWRFGATPGKLALGMRVIRPGADHVRMSLPRSIARHFAQYVTNFTVFVGYIMAVFDSERQTLHDRICDTRVILVK